MAEIKISALDLAPVTPTGTEVFAVVQGSTTHKTTIDSLKPALVDNLSAGAPTWDVNGNLTAGYDIIAGGNHTGKVALTINDGYGNANLTFNHTDGIPDVSGSSGRISCAVDSNQEVMEFQLKGSATAGSALSLTSVLKLYDDGIQLLQATTCLTPTQNTHVARKDYVDTALDLKATAASVTAVDSSLTNHIGAITSHTKAQVGLSNVNNTSDDNKPISTATQTALDGKIGESEINTSHFTFTNSTLSLKTIAEGQIGTGAVSPGKLSTGAPSWSTAGRLTVDGEIRVGEDTGDGVPHNYINGSRVGTLDTLILEGDDVIDIKTRYGTESSIKIFGAAHPTVPNQIYHKADYHIFQNKEGGTVAKIPPTSTPTLDNHLVTKEYVDSVINSSAVIGLLSVPLSKNYPSYYIQGTVISGSLTGVWSGQGNKLVSETIVFSLKNVSTGSTEEASFYDLTEYFSDAFSSTETFTRDDYTIPTSGLYQLETSSNFTATSGATATPPV